MKKGKLFRYYSREGVQSDFANKILQKKEFWSGRSKGFTGLGTY